MANGRNGDGIWADAVRGLLDDVECMFFAYDRDEPHTLRAASRSFADVIGHEPATMVGLPIEKFVVLDDWRAVMKSGVDGRFFGDVRLRHTDGTMVWVRSHSRLTVVGDRPMVAGMALSVDELKRHEIDLGRRMEIDELTGLIGRDKFVARLVQQLETGASVVAGILDLDGFKQVNDTLGHPAGDEVLSTLGERLTFLVNDRLVISRLGGDEFGVLMLGEWSDPEVMTAAQRMIDTISEPIDLDGIEVQSRPSVGLARSVFGSSSAEIMRQADVAMYESKRKKSGPVMYLEGSDAPQTRRDLAIIAQLRRSLEQQLELHYQPIIDLWTGETVAVEGLARWQHSERGLLYPGEFLPAIEVGGLSERLDLWAIEAASEIGVMKTHSGEPLKVSVNVTAEGLQSLRIIPRIRRLIESGALAADQLILEISERNVQDDLATVRPVLEELRDMGVRISLDDFGTGFSSLTRLRDLPFSEVKMDRSFVSKMHKSEADLEIVRTTVQLGRALGLTVVAEGVETKAIADGAGAVGCSFAQGNFYAGPMPLAALLSKGLVLAPDYPHSAAA